MNHAERHYSGSHGGTNRSNDNCTLVSNQNSTNCSIRISTVSNRQKWYSCHGKILPYLSLFESFWGQVKCYIFLKKDLGTNKCILARLEHEVHEETDFIFLVHIVYLASGTVLEQNRHYIHFSVFDGCVKEHQPWCLSFLGTIMLLLLIIFVGLEPTSSIGKTTLWWCHSERNQPQYEKTTYWMGEDIFKW